VRDLLQLPLLLLLLQEPHHSLLLAHYKGSLITLQHLACCMIGSSQTAVLQSELGTSMGQQRDHLQSSRAAAHMTQQLLPWQLQRLQLQQQLPALAALGASSCWSGCNAAADAAVHSSLMAAGAAATADAQVVPVPVAVPQSITRPGMKMPGSKHEPR
jgi:hypothetical protein